MEQEFKYKEVTYDNYEKAYSIIIQDYLSEKDDNKKKKIKLILNDLNTKRIQLKKYRLIEFWKNFNSELKEPKDVPDLPTDKYIYENLVIPKLINCGAIPKKRLKVNNFYYGDWRRGGYAKWDGEKFHIWRYKFEWFLDTANHFEDDNGFSLFVPLREITEIEFKNRKLN